MHGLEGIMTIKSVKASLTRMPLPSLTGVSIDRLKSFLLVAEAGGHARAAPGDPVRQSQLSRQVSELEVALAQELFVRSGRGMSDFFWACAALGISVSVASTRSRADASTSAAMSVL